MLVKINEILPKMRYGYTESAKAELQREVLTLDEEGRKQFDTFSKFTSGRDERTIITDSKLVHILEKLVDTSILSGSPVIR